MNNNTSSSHYSSNEASHYVVTAHPPGGVLTTTKCNFTSPNSTDIIIAKSRKLEIRQNNDDTSTTSNNNAFPILLSLPIYGRIVCLEPIQLVAASSSSPTSSYLFLLTDKLRYAVISYNTTTSSVTTHASGSLQKDNLLLTTHRQADSGPLISVCNDSCVALHVYDGLLTILPMNKLYDGSRASSSKSTTTQSSSSSSLLKTPSILHEPFHLRLEERTVLSIQFAASSLESRPTLVLLHQDSKYRQHVTSYVLDLAKKQFDTSSSSLILKRANVDGGSSLLLPVPATMTTTSSNVAAAASSSTSASTTADSQQHIKGGGGVLVIGQRQITWIQFHSVVKVIPIPPSIIVCARRIMDDTADNDDSSVIRFLLAHDSNSLSLLAVNTHNQTMQFDTLGTTTTTASSLEYLSSGKIFLGSYHGDSQLVQMHDEPIVVDNNGVTDNLQQTSYLSTIEEYMNLGPIVDFDLVPTQQQQDNSSSSTYQQSQVVTASGSSTSGSLRLIRNGIGMNEYASVEMGGIQNMWSLRKSFVEREDKYLVQSFVGETRVLGVVSATTDAGSMEEDEEEAGSLEEVVLAGLTSDASSLYVGNVQVGDTFLQITESEIRLIDASSLECTATWSPSQQGEMQDDEAQLIIVASANEAGQIAVALRGGTLLYFCVKDASTIELVYKTKMENEISCLDLHPFAPLEENSSSTSSSMDVDDKVAHQSSLVAVGLWDDFTVRLLSLESNLEEVLQINLSDEDEDDSEDAEMTRSGRRNRTNMMARSLCLVTLDSASSASGRHAPTRVNMLFVGLGDGTLISFAVLPDNGSIVVQSKKEVSLGTQRIDLVPIQTEEGATCVLATGDRPSVIYLAGGGGVTASNFSNPKLCYSNVNLSGSDAETEDDVNRPPAQQSIVVNVATPFFSPDLFDASSLGNRHYSLCVADDTDLRLGVIDDIQKLHVTTCRLGMSPRRVVHCLEGRMFAVGCIENDKNGAAVGMNNCIRFLDDTTFDDVHRIDMEPNEMILSMVYANMGGSESGVGAKPYLLVGTAFVHSDEDEPTRGRIVVYSVTSDDESQATRKPRHISELVVRGGVYSMCQFYGGKVLATVNSKMQVCQLKEDVGGSLRLSYLGIGHHGHLLSLFVKSKAGRQPLVTASSSDDMLPDNDDEEDKKPAAASDEIEQLAIVGDLMRSISLVRYYPEHEALEEVARDFNANWTTAVEMLTDDIYVGAENWNNIFVLRRNTKAQAEEVRCRLETVGEYHLGEMCNKFMTGSLVMPHSSSTITAGDGRRKVAALRTTSPAKKSAAAAAKTASTTTTSRIRRPTVTIGSQTLFATTDGTLGSILGLDARTAVFFTALQRAMAKVVRPIGDLSHAEFRTFEDDRRVHPSHGFVDGDLVESFLDLDRDTMESVVEEMNRDGRWDIDYQNLPSEGKHAGEDEEDEDMGNNEHELAVEDVLAMVEEMALQH